MRRFRATAVWTPEGLLRDRVVEVVRHQVRAVRPPRPGDPDPHEGLLVPGLVNAHTHLELSWLHRRVPGGHGFLSWVRELLAAVEAQDPEARSHAAEAAAELARLGTAAVSDVTNDGGTGPLLLAAGVSGVVQHELLGLDRSALPAALALADEIGGELIDDRTRIVVRPAIHALFSTAPELVQRVCAAWAAAPASIHVAEDIDELRFLADGSGGWPDRLDALGLDWRWWTPPGCSPIVALDRLGVLGPRLLLVHGVHLDAADRALLREREAPLCLCPRSNLHITGGLPDVPALLEAGVRLCLGTDSLASCDDLDVLAEIPVLAEAFPEVPAEVWLDLATRGGADALEFDDLGRIAPGARPGLLLLEGVDDPADLLRAAPARRWLLRPGVP